jgi:hypothetical protein
VFLVDNTYQALNDFVELINQSEFVELVSSKFAIFEFIGVRKREHYLRSVAARSSTAAGGEINFSSLLKFKDDYSARGIDFDSVIPDIEIKVNAEIERVFEHYKINFDYGSLHNGQLEPTRDLCLASKLANQDCMILISSVLPEEDKTFSRVLLLTEDQKFIDISKSRSLASVLGRYSIPLPQLVPLNNIQHSGSPAMNLTAPTERLYLKRWINNYLLLLIRDRASFYYLGTTIEITGARVPKNCVAFRLTGRDSLPKSAYITVLSKDLDFIYSTKSEISDFRHNGSRVTPDHRFLEGDNNISFLLTDIDETGDELEILSSIRTPGNLVFVHPDSVGESQT